LATLARHVERLEFLDRVAVRTHPHALLHHGVQVDEHVVAQQVVDLVFADSVARSEREQMGALVGRVVVDVHRRMLRPPLCDVREKLLQRRALFGVVMRPEGAERVIRLDESEQVVQTPLGRLGIAVGTTRRRF
jgi:hypothetical protein